MHPGFSELLHLTHPLLYPHIPEDMLQPQHLRQLLTNLLSDPGKSVLQLHPYHLLRHMYNPSLQELLQLDKHALDLERMPHKVQL